MKIHKEEFQEVSKSRINRGHPVDLLLPVWFPAIMRLACAQNGCEDCQEAIDRERHFPLIVNTRSIV